MISGAYGQGRRQLPRVLHITVSRYARRLPRRGEPLEFLVSIHEEGTAITWQRNARVAPALEREMLDLTAELYRWSLNLALTPDQARERLKRLGARLHDAFIGEDGAEYLRTIAPTAVLFDVDETVLNLPWELIAGRNGALSQGVPFGRVVSTRTTPKLQRDPVKEDNTVRILAVANPTLDLAAGEAEARALQELEGHHGAFDVSVVLLPREEATGARLRELLAMGDFDILHLSGHASLDPRQPDRSALQLADGAITARDVLGLQWKQPPYLVFNSACESGRAAGGRRLVSGLGGGNANGLAAAFLAAGVAAYVGYFWPVTDAGAAQFARTFYRSMFERENVGLAFMDARQDAAQALADVGDLTGFSAVLFGDAGSAHRRDLAMAV